MGSAGGKSQKMTDEEQPIHLAGDLTQPPDLRILHYNDVCE